MPLKHTQTHTRLFKNQTAEHQVSLWCVCVCVFTLGPLEDAASVSETCRPGDKVKEVGLGFHIIFHLARDGGHFGAPGGGGGSGVFGVKRHGSSGVG